MYGYIADILARYERGEVRRRDLIAGIVALASVSKSMPAQASATFRGVDVNHVALNVTDVKRSRDFYQKHLGLPVVRETGSSCFLDLGKDFLALFHGGSPGMNHYCLSIEDFEVGRVTQELQRQGLNPRQPSGSQRVYFHDPDGIEVQLCSTSHQA
jgi:catechol 2,3-dioxygenase-like lactoylglutathione lyase family enzyme